MKLYSYIVAHDSGFAPNPFWGFCTLANCKPKIRERAQPGDWIVGLASRTGGNGIVYAMEVDEVMGYGDYFNDPRFAAKIPDHTRLDYVQRCGDNCYEPLPDGGFRQLPSHHSAGALENPKLKATDLSGRNVLIAKRFHYFGSQPLPLPESLDTLIVARGYRCNFPPEIVDGFLKFIGAHPRGVNAPPERWPKGNQSWAEFERACSGKVRRERE